jgi:D-alanyl-D-alanine carboxypeptidase
MMRRHPSSRSRSPLLLLLATACLYGCEDTKGLQLGSNAPVFDAALFRQNIQAALHDNIAHMVGYTFVINQLGNLADSAQVGFARMPQDGGIPHSIDKDMNIASVTKWLTAVGALQLLHNVSLDQPMWPWLPQSWTLGPGVQSITFRELLTHKTGLTTPTIRYSTHYDSLKTAIETGVANAEKAYNYSNVNFALFRILFAYLDNAATAASQEQQLLTVQQDTAAFAQYLAERYLEIMQAKVFTPAGVSNALMSPGDGNTTTLMYYRFNPTQSGSSVSDWTLRGGGGGYFLSAAAVASVLAHVFHTNAILSAPQVAEMLADLLGFDSRPTTAHGPSYQKDGALFTDTNRSGGFDNGDQGLQTLIMKFPGGVELVLFVNSLGNGWTDYVPLMVNAFNNAWVSP